MLVHILLIIVSLFTDQASEKKSRPFHRMPVFQEWQCDSFLYDPQRQHWHNMIKKTSDSRKIAPSFYSAIDTIPILIDGKEYYRYWPFIVNESNYDSLIINTPKLDSIIVPMVNDGVSFYRYHLIRQEDQKIYFLSPYYYFAQKWLIDNPDDTEVGERRYRNRYEENYEEISERIFWDIGNLIPDSSYSYFGLLNQVKTKQGGNEIVYKFKTDRRIHEYNVCVDEFHVSEKNGIIGIKLYNIIWDPENDEQRFQRQECECKIN